MGIIGRLFVQGERMKIIQGLTPGLLGKAALTIGNFDGVHLGHQALLRVLIEQAKKRTLPTVLITFQPNAKQFFSKEKNTSRISSFSDKISQLCNNGIDYVVVLKFNERFSQLSAQDFLLLLKESVNPRYLLIGNDFRFGHQRTGDKELIQSFFQNECEVFIFNEVQLDAKRVSSTAIRRSLKEQDLQGVNRALGRAYSITGRVCYGRQLGQEIGVPTANISLNRQPLPFRGVFCVELINLEDNKRYRGVANIGVRPTVDGKNSVCEVHLLNFSGSLYGKRVQVTVLEKLRNEQTFEGLEPLIEQIKKDVLQANNYFRLR